MKGGKAMSPKRLFKKMLETIANDTTGFNDVLGFVNCIETFFRCQKKCVEIRLQEYGSSEWPVIRSLGYVGYLIIVAANSNPYQIFKAICLGIVLIIWGEKYIYDYIQYPLDNFWERHNNIREAYEELLLVSLS